MRFEIRRVENGVVLKIGHDEDEPEEELVYQERDEGEVEAFAEFLRELVLSYGPSTGRYSPRRIHIRVEPGDNYDPPSRSPSSTRRIRNAGSSFFVVRRGGGS